MSGYEWFFVDSDKSFAEPDAQCTSQNFTTCIKIVELGWFPIVFDVLKTIMTIKKRYGWKICNGASNICGASFPVRMSEVKFVDIASYHSYAHLRTCTIKLNAPYMFWTNCFFRQDKLFSKVFILDAIWRKMTCNFRFWRYRWFSLVQIIGALFLKVFIHNHWCCESKGEWNLINKPS